MDFRYLIIGCLGFLCCVIPAAPDRLYAGTKTTLPKKRQHPIAANIPSAPATAKQPSKKTSITTALQEAQNSLGFAMPEKALELASLLLKEAEARSVNTTQAKNEPKKKEEKKPIPPNEYRPEIAFQYFIQSDWLQLKRAAVTNSNNLSAQVTAIEFLQRYADAHLLRLRQKRLDFYKNIDEIYAQFQDKELTEKDFQWTEKQFYEFVFDLGLWHARSLWEQNKNNEAHDLSSSIMVQIEEKSQKIQSFFKDKYLEAVSMVVGRTGFEIKNPQTNIDILMSAQKFYKEFDTPFPSLLQLRLGLFYFLNHQYENARVALTQLIANNSSVAKNNMRFDAAAAFYIGLSYLREHDKTQAEQWFKNAAERDLNGYFDIAAGRLLLFNSHRVSSRLPQAFTAMERDLILKNWGFFEETQSPNLSLKKVTKSTNIPQNRSSLLGDLRFIEISPHNTKAAPGVGRGAKSEGERRVHETYTSEPSEDATTANTSGSLSTTSSLVTNTQAAVLLTQIFTLGLHGTNAPSESFLKQLKGIIVEKLLTPAQLQEIQATDVATSHTLVKALIWVSRELKQFHQVILLSGVLRNSQTSLKDYSPQTTKASAVVGRGAKRDGERRVHETYTSEPSEDATTANNSGRLSNHEFLLSFYPRPFYAEFVKASQACGTDLHLLYAISRQESLFQPAITSSAGAKGLMQLMPATASKVLRKHFRWPVKKPIDLTDVQTNLYAGACYLKDLLNQFSQNPALAAAAYNAGEAFVQSWQERRNRYDEPEIFNEFIPFLETKIYVQKVLRNIENYNWIYLNNDAPQNKK